MDGNGRWAVRRGLPRTAGHLEGLKAAKRVVKAASDAGLKYLTLYVFSTENWKRAAEETGFIMGLVKQYLRGEFDFYRENKIRIRHAGDAAGLPPDIASELKSAMEDTAGFDGMQVVLALNYGGRGEIVRAVNKIVSHKGTKGTKDLGDLGEITESVISSFLDNPDIPDPDLIIRSAGEYRTSNFLLWEAAYAEYYVSETLWPDFGEGEFQAALGAYGKRERRFGGVTK
jgi:undecaprenyl diphosphate synthase